MSVIRLKPDEVWDFYVENLCRLKRQEYTVAEEPGSASIVLRLGEDDYPVVYVMYGESIYSIALFSSKEEMESKLPAMYKKYISDYETGSSYEEIERDTDDEIFEREDQLKLAFYDFMVAVVEEEDLIYDGEFDDQISEIMEETLKTISYYGFPIRRPMWVEDKNGEKKLVDFPYEEEP